MNHFKISLSSVAPITSIALAGVLGLGLATQSERAYANAPQVFSVEFAQADQKNVSKGKAKPIISQSKLDAQSFSDIFISSLLLQRGQIPQGFALMQRAALRTQDEALLRQILRVAISVGRPELGRDALRSWLSQQPDSLEALNFALVLMHPSQPDFEAAIKKHLNVVPNSALRTDFAQRLIAQERYVEAQIQLETAVKRKPQDAKAWLLLGTLQWDRQNLKGAQASFEKVLSILNRAGVEDAVALPATQSKGATSANEDKALAQLRSQLQGKAQASQEALFTEQARAKLLQIFVKTKQYKEADALIAKLPRNSAEESEAAKRIERSFWMESGQWQRAYDTLDVENKRNWVAKAPDVDSLYDQAIAAEKIGRFDEMERLLKLVMEIDSAHYNAPNALGYAWVERGVRLGEARVLIERALKLSPESGYIWDSLGWLEFKDGNMQKAVEHLKKAYTLQPDPEIAAHLGEAHWFSGDQEQARKIWREGLKMDKTHAALRATVIRLAPTLPELAVP